MAFNTKFNFESEKITTAEPTTMFGKLSVSKAVADDLRMNFKKIFNVTL